MGTTPIFSATVPGVAAGSKNAQQVIYPGLPGGIKGALFGASRLPPSQMRGRLVQIAKTANPVIVNSAKRERWMSLAQEVFRATADLVRRRDAIESTEPLVPVGNLIHVRTVVYLAESQTGDLNNFEHGVWDALDHCGVIASDHWINCHDGSRRDWSDPFNPRVEVTMWDLGPRVLPSLPAVRVLGLKAYRQGRFAENQWTARDPLGREAQGTLANGTNRKRLVASVQERWRTEFGCELPDGSQVWVGDLRPPTQASIAVAR